jgi:Outer membrane protein beta-barrel domain
MKKYLFLVVCCLALMPYAKAQEDNYRFDAGVFADYFRLGATGTNMFGIGGRAGVELVPHIGIEGEFAFDFNRGFVDSFENEFGGASYVTSGVRDLHALFGPRFSVDRGPIRPFAEVKVGFDSFTFNNLPQGLNSLSNPIQNLRNQTLNAALLLGGGLEAKVAGRVGVRLDVGDELYFNNGVQHGLKATFGPVVRF